MSEEMIIDFIRTFGDFMSEFESFLTNIAPGYYVLIGGLSMAAVIGAMFYVVQKQLKFNLIWSR